MTSNRTAALIASLACASCGAGGRDEPVHCNQRALAGGQPAAAERDFALIVESGQTLCTGTALGPRSVLVAAHCIDAGAGQAVLRRGLRGETCIGTVAADGRCAPTPVTVTAHPDADLALLRTTDIIPAPTAGFPTVGAATNVQAFEFVGYGVGSVAAAGDECVSAAGEELLTGTFSVGWEDDQYLGATAQPAQPAVCAGDSGGPAFVLDGARPFVIATLAQSSAGSGGCTPAGGLQLWQRIDPYASWLASLLSGP